MTLRPTRHRRRSAAALLVTASLALGGCSASNQLSQQARAGDSKSYVAGDGSVTEVSPGERGEPVSLTGPATGGGQVDVPAWRGDVVVVNVWYAACPPCRAEAPDLVDISGDYAADGVRFVGVNTEDGEATALSFEREFGIDYPSVLDARTGAALVALRGQVPPGAVPTTLVLDRTGRVAARVLGRVDPDVLRDLLDGVLAEPA